jgi:hypothetical protein
MVFATFYNDDHNSLVFAKFYIDDHNSIVFAKYYNDDHNSLVFAKFYNDDHNHITMSWCFPATTNLRIDIDGCLHCLNVIAAQQL